MKILVEKDKTIYYSLDSSNLDSTKHIENFYETTVIVLTYEPVKSRLWYTLDSILMQKKANFEIIVSDDGSKENYFKEIIKYFENKKFKDYSIVLHNKNEGTVKNVFSAVKLAKGKFVKLISPGDALVSSDTLCLWVEFLKKSGKQWSFGEALYYTRTEENKLFLTKKYCHPQIIDCYLKHKDEECRVNYVGFDDNALGSAVLCQTELMLKYLKKIIGKCIYAEDNSYRLMAFDNILPEYYPRAVIFYEYGTGISTSCDDAWYKKIRNDFESADNIMLSSSKKDNIQKRIVEINKIKYRTGLFNRIRKKFFKGQIRMTFYKKFRPRMSKTDFTL